MILLIGATGFLGRHVLKRLQDRKVPMRVLARGSGDWQDQSVRVKQFRQRGIEVTLCDIKSTSAVERAAEGSTCIINLAGVMRGATEEELEAVQLDAVEQLLAIIKEKNIQRYIQVSCLGAESDSECVYLKTKWEAEELVKQSNCYWTIFRPSFLFGESFPLLDILMPCIKMPMMMPVIGSGMNQLQPVWVEDVADCIVDSIYDRESVGQSFELGGPDVFTMSELMLEARQALGLAGSAINIPSDKAAKTVSALQKFVPRSPINADLAHLLVADSVTNQNALTEKFKIEPKPLDDLLLDIVKKK
jgi:NADH dehydrogenase